MFWCGGDVHSSIQASSVLVPPDDVMLGNATSDHQRIRGFNVPRQVAHHLLIGQGVKVEIPVFLPEHEQLGTNGTVGDAWNAHGDAMFGRPVDEGILRADLLAQGPHQVDGAEAKPSVCSGQSCFRQALSPDFFEAYVEFSSVPWKTGTLEPKIKEFIYIAIDTATTHLHKEGSRIHIRNALEHGATKEEIMEVFQCVSVLGMHALTEGGPMLMQAARQADAAE